MRSRWGGLGLLLALGCWPASAQDVPKVALEAHSVFGDIVRYGCPYQAQIDVTVNDSAVNQDSILEVDGGTSELSSHTPVKLTPGKRTYVVPIACAQYGQEARLLKAAGGPYTTMMQPSVATEQDYVALTLTPRKNQFNYLGGYKGLLKQGEFRLNQPRKGVELPDLWWTYLGHDAVVIHDLPALKLSDRVEAALLEYAQAGGNLVLVSNLDPHELKGSPLAELAPLRAESTDSAAGRLIGKPVSGAEVVLRDAGHLPLLLKRPYGAGTIWQITAPIDTQDVLGTQKTSDVWRKVLKEQGSLEVRKSFDDYGDRLSVLPELPAPATAALAWYLAAYVLVVIPGIYVYLRRRDQVLRLIVVVPTCSVLITLLAYFVNSSGRGRELVLRELGVAWVRGGEREVLLRQQGVLFSPAALKYSLDFPSDTLMRPRYRARDEQTHILSCRGETLLLEPEQMRQWGLSRWAGMGLRKLSAPISLKIKQAPRQLKLTIDNQSDLQGRAVLATSSGMCSKPFAVGKGRQEIDVDMQAQGPMNQALKSPEMGGLTPGDATSLESEIQLRRLPGPALVLSLEDERFAVMRLQGQKPRAIRRTYLVVSENQP